MEHLILAPVLAAIVTLCALLLMLRRGRDALPLDRPNERSLHDRPVPRIGGLALMAGCAAGWALAPPSGLQTLWLALGAVFAVSLLDDLMGLGFGWRLAVHLLAASGVVWTFAPPGTGIAIALAIVLALGWLTNLYNFMDGSDGLAGGMAVTGFAAYGIAAFAAGDAGYAVLDWIIVGAALAFLLFNFHPARVFMGDAGSIPLGFLAGSLGLAGWTRGLWPAWFPVLVFAPFIADATVTLARRALRGERVWRAHRSHYYQRLVQLGFGHRNTALAEYALMIFCAASALAAREATPAAQAGVVSGVALIHAALMLAIDRAWSRHNAACGG